MFVIKFRKHKSDKFKEVFIGEKSFFTVSGFLVGSILIGRSLWEYGKNYIGVLATLLLGVLLFIFSGIILKKFNK